MRCPSCNFENREGVRFCENCGNGLAQASPPVVPYSAPIATQLCPYCGQANAQGASFCMYCGGNMRQVAAPMAFPRQRRRGCLVWASLLFILFLMCGFTYWIALIPVPVLAIQSAPPIVVEVVRTLRITQENLPRPQVVEDLTKNLNGQDEPKPIIIAQGRGDGNGDGNGDGDGDGTDVVFALPDACHPDVELEVENISKTQAWDLLGTFGIGPLIYEIKNTGESMADSQYGYYAMWVVYDDGKQNIVPESTWYSCSGWGENHLTCTGPDWQKHDSAELYIYSENPDCPLAVAIFSFQGEDPYPTTDPTDYCTPTGTFTLKEHIPNADYAGLVNPEHGDLEAPMMATFVFEFEGPPLADANPFYIQTSAATVQSMAWVRIESCQTGEGGQTLYCIGFNPQAWILEVSWRLYTREPAPSFINNDNSECPPFLSGTVGGTPVADAEPEPQSCIPDIVRQINNYSPLKMQDRDNWKPNFDHPFAVSLPSLPGLDLDKLEFYATYDVFDSQGNPVILNASYNCYGRSLYAIPCDGPDVKDDQSVAMRLYYANDGCNELLSEKQWTAISVAQPITPIPVTDRCSLFNQSTIKVAYLDWMSGAPLTFYFKMPGGVPGLEKKIPGDTDLWEYSATIGTYNSKSCEFMPGYEERLYCSIDLPSGYSNAVRPLTLSVNGCNSPIYSNQTAYLPGIESDGGGGQVCPPGQTYHPPNSNWPGGCCSDGHWYIWGSDTEPGCWN